MISTVRTTNPEVRICPSSFRVLALPFRKNVFWHRLPYLPFLKPRGSGAVIEALVGLEHRLTAYHRTVRRVVQTHADLGHAARYHRLRHVDALIQLTRQGNHEPVHPGIEIDAAYNRRRPRTE
ncbi:MAG TPA: hypothetical protein VOA41_20220 [Candidatus Dormibacteraeota bacterium]|nr:hypothetical protein [Candidatus Dormibacteraeota bacterium]